MLNDTICFQWLHIWIFVQQQQAWKIHIATKQIQTRDMFLTLCQLWTWLRYGIDGGGFRFFMIFCVKFCMKLEYWTWLALSAIVEPEIRLDIMWGMQYYNTDLCRILLNSFHRMKQSMIDKLENTNPTFISPFSFNIPKKNETK